MAALSVTLLAALKDSRLEQHWVFHSVDLTVVGTVVLSAELKVVLTVVNLGDSWVALKGKMKVK